MRQRDPVLRRAKPLDGAERSELCGRGRPGPHDQHLHLLLHRAGPGHVPGLLRPDILLPDGVRAAAVQDTSVLYYYRAILRQDIGWFDGNPSGELASRLSKLSTMGVGRGGGGWGREGRGWERVGERRRDV